MPNAQAEMTPLERAARAVCARSLSGFCQNIGGNLGCEVGRGKMPHWSLCKATDAQLDMAGHTDEAADAISAYRAVL